MVGKSLLKQKEIVSGNLHHIYIYRRASFFTEGTIFWHILKNLGKKFAFNKILGNFAPDYVL